MPMLTKKLPKHWRIQSNKSDLFDVSVDERDTYRDKPSVLISSVKAAKSDSVLLEQVIDGTDWYGKRVRFSCFAKTVDVDESAMLSVSVQNPHGTVIVYDPMIDRSLKDNNDWTELSVVVDIPRDGRWITFGPQLTGKGKLWAAQFKVEEVSKDVSRTDDHGGFNGVLPQPYNLDFAESASADADSNEAAAAGWRCPQDRVNQRYSIEKNAFAGANAAVIELPIDKDNAEQFGYYCQSFSATPFRGGRIKFSSYIKTEKAVEGAYLVLMVNSVHSRLALSTMGDEALAGDNDWTECSRVLDVSEFAYSISLWLQMSGSGKAYFSQVAVEAVSPEVPKTDNNHQPRNLDFTE